MSEEHTSRDQNGKKRRNREAEKKREDHKNDIRLRLMKKDGDRLMLALNSAKMVGILSGLEIMYVFIFNDQYLCFIHPLASEEGRYKAWPVREDTTAMIKHLADIADQLFEITPKANMDPMGVMVSAEPGIVTYLDATGQLPAEDTDFMSWTEEASGENGGEA